VPPCATTKNVSTFPKTHTHSEIVQKVSVTHLHKCYIEYLNSRAFVPITPPCTEEPSPIIIRVAAGPRFRRSAHTPKVPLSGRHHLYLDPCIMPTPSSLRHLAPPHATSMHRGGDNVRVIRVWSTSPYTWVRGSYTGQCESGDVERCSCDCAIAWEWKRAERVNKGTQVYGWRYWTRARVMHR